MANPNPLRPTPTPSPKPHNSTDLPHEITLIILNNLTDIHSLLNFIQASASAFRTFNSKPTPILETLLTYPQFNGTRELICILLQVAQPVPIRSYAHLLNSSSALQTALVQPFLTLFHLAKDLTDIEKLSTECLRTHHEWLHRIAHYSHCVAEPWESVCLELPPPVPSLPNPSFSNTERLRARRALLNFKICGRLLVPGKGDDETTAQESSAYGIRLAKAHLATLQPWELDSMYCAYNYLEYHEALTGGYGCIMGHDGRRAVDQRLTELLSGLHVSTSAQSTTQPQLAQRLLDHCTNTLNDGIDSGELPSGSWYFAVCAAEHGVVPLPSDDFMRRMGLAFWDRWRLEVLGLARSVDDDISLHRRCVFGECIWRTRSKDLTCCGYWMESYTREEERATVVFENMRGDENMDLSYGESDGWEAILRQKGRLELKFADAVRQGRRFCPADRVPEVFGHLSGHEVEQRREVVEVWTPL